MRTRQKSLNTYFDIHAGPLIELHYLYADLLTLIFVAFLHGIG